MRLVLLFLLLALATTGIFLAGMQRALSGGWSGVVRPLVADYVDRLAADIGSPPDVARAQALVQRLPLSVRIEGPALQFDSHPQRRAWHRAADRDEDDDGRWLLQRQTADGHRITFGLGDRGWATRPRTIGWITLAAAAAAHRCGLRLRARICSGRWTTSAAARYASARGSSTRRSRCGAATSWAIWPNRSTPWRATSAACSTPSAACCWR